MSKVIGARIPDKIYEKIYQLSISNTEIIKQALEQYLEMNVNTSEKGVNNVLFEDGYQVIRQKVDQILSHLEALNEKS